jgi:Transposase, Mutator family
MLLGEMWRAAGLLLSIIALRGIFQVVEGSQGWLLEETLTYYAFPEEHWRRIRTNNLLERILREIRRRTRVVGAFPDGQSALNLAAARPRHIAGTAWSTKRYLNIELLKYQQMRGAITASARAGCRSAKLKVRKILDTTNRRTSPAV